MTGNPHHQVCLIYSALPHQANQQEVPSKALRDARLATRLAEAEGRKLKLERDRLARENALLTQRLERKIDTLEHATEPNIHGALPPTPISNPSTNKTKKQRPADIITNFEDLEDPFYDGLVTGGLLTKLPKFNPNRLLDILGHPRSENVPRRAPIPTPEPPYEPFEPLTPEGRRRSAERMISDPEREKALAEERAYYAAVRAVEFEFEERRSDGYALLFTLLRKQLNIPVRDVRAKLDDIVEEEEEGKIENGQNTENDRKDEVHNGDDGEESSDSDLSDGEFNVSSLLIQVDLKGNADCKHRGDITRHPRLCRAIAGLGRVFTTVLDFSHIRPD